MLSSAQSCRLVTAGRYAGTHDVDWHVHSGHEIILVTEGRCDMSAGRDLFFPGTAGTVYVLPAGLEQYHRSHEFTRDIYLLFHAAPPLYIATPRVLQVPLDSLCASLFASISTLSLSPAAAESQAVLDALLLALLEEVNRLEARVGAGRRQHPAVQAALEYMEARLDEPLSLDLLARRSGVSPNHLTALFRTTLGTPPMKLHTGMRLELAGKLLRGRQQSCKEVAAAAGFLDVNYFIRMFRRHFGLAPAAWLRRQDESECHVQLR